MGFTSVFPAHHFPLRSGLLARTGEQTLEGDVARRLAAGVIGYLALEPSVDETVARTAEAGPGAYMPLVASLRPLGSMWVEAARRDGSRYGLLRMDDRDGTVRVRHIEVLTDGGPARCLPASVALRRSARGRQHAIDWEGLRKGRVAQDAKAEKRWLKWAGGHLALEMLVPGSTPAEAMEAHGRTGVRDLLTLAVAASPLGSPRLESLLAALDAYRSPEVRTPL